MTSLSRSIETMRNSQDQNALIVGAGIGGLTTALALQAHGWHVRVIEKAPELREVGAGIQISPNASRVLRALDLLEPLMDVSVMPTRIEMVLGIDGRPVFSVPAGSAAAVRWGAPYLHCHRADLVDVLAAALEARQPGALELGVAVEKVIESAEDIALQTTLNRHERASLVIAADGVRSTIRSQVFGDAAPRFTGNVAWRCTVPTSALGEHAPPATARAWVGPGRHAVTYRLRGGDLVNFVGVVETDAWSDERWTAKGTQNDALQDFASWHPTLQRIIESADTHYRWALFDREPLDRWSTKNLTLLGDSCHAMLPFVAQGAAMAIEDAWVLARSLHPDRDLAAGLRSYERHRIPRTSDIQRRASANTGRFHARSSIGQWWYWQIPGVAAKLMPSLIHRQFDAIYGHDVVNEMRGH